MKHETSTMILVLAGLALVTGALLAQPASVKDDPLVRMPGSQPAPEGNVSFEAPGRCLNCHAGYNTEVEPGFQWKGSMMAQAARDFLFFACMTTAAQDSVWAIGRPNATDICLRCHFPKGWLEGRSEPTNATAMTGADWDGVQCDFCHTSFDPFFETTYDGSREGNDWLGYWDETNASGTPSDLAAASTYTEDQAQGQGLLLFNGGPFLVGNLYTENASGQYFLSTGSQKRAPFADAAARHQMLYSRYHKSKYFCATCHDVSNPILANYTALLASGLNPEQALALTREDFVASGGSLFTEDNPAYNYFHVERTFSEFMLSAYGQPGGAATNPEFQAQGAPGIVQAAKCQDCHMRDVVGTAADKQGVPIRPNDSIEHPQSGQPLHDMTGGNVWVSTVLASAIPGSPNYDDINDGLLNQGPGALTLDLNQGEGIDPVALLAGADRARQQLLLAASILDPDYNQSNGTLSFRIQNNSGHKLISGFPEGRRMFVNIKAYAGGNLVYEVNPYDDLAGTLKGLPSSPNSPALASNEVYVDGLVYEMHPTSSADVPDANGIGLTGETKTFHFALATGRYKDNRIPPQGFRIGEAPDRLSVPVWHGVADPGFYTEAEYAGGYDEVSLTIATGAETVEVGLYYQTTSREYIEFLRDEIRGTGSLTLSSPTPAGNPEAYIVQTDPFFDQLRAWGDTIWNLWTHNMNVDGAKPFLMTQATVGVAPPSCELAAPTLLSATPGNQEVTLTWSAVSGAAGYTVYYDQAGKAQLVADSGNTTIYLDSGLTNGQEYCYKVTSYDTTCESGYSNILCAIPNAQGQLVTGVDTLITGRYETSGKGKNQTTVFVETDSFTAGDEIVIRAHVIDQDTGLPLANATVDLEISGPETNSLSAASDSDGIAEVSWQTEKPNKRGQGGTTPGSYTATVVGVTAAGYGWDGIMTSAAFSLQ
jgi:hypothetical protein